MKVAKRNVPIVVLALLAAAILMSSRPVFTQQPAAPVPPSHFHHIQLNSMNPSAAIDYYIKAFPTSTKVSLGGLRWPEDGQRLRALHEG